MKRYSPFFSIFLLLFVFPVGLHAGYTTISADTLQKWITQGASFDFLLIDVREVSEATSIIATDACKPYLLPWTSGVFAQTISKLPKDTAIVLYCKSGGRSGQAAKMLSDSGFIKVYSLADGFTGWGSRPTKSASDIKPTGKLPEPSMVKGTSVIGKRPDLVFFKREMSFSENKINILSPIAFLHTLNIFNTQGKCVVRIQNPFANRTVFTLPRQSEGLYVAALESGFYRCAMTVRIVQ
jgi:rhodanese-related sulfurtransferase